MTRVVHVYVADDLHKRVWQLVDKPDETLTEFVTQALERECARREKKRRAAD